LKLTSNALLQFIFDKLEQYPRRTILNYFLNWYKFLNRASLSSLLNSMLHYWYIYSALKIISYNNIVFFCLQTSEMYPKWNFI